jgi:uncharacterized protein (DUF433 family)
VDIGRGPQIEASRLTVMDVFYYLHRGHDFEFIHRAMPALTRPQFDAVVAYVNAHRDELAEVDRRIEERNNREAVEQQKKGVRRPIDSAAPVEERAARLKEKFKARTKEQAEKNGAPPAR